MDERGDLSPQGSAPKERYKRHKLHPKDINLSEEDHEYQN